jgi:acetoin utilization deacetylase AcuC-like enzyme
MNRKLLLYYPAGHEAHSFEGHPERPERVETIRHALEAGGFWNSARLLEPLFLDDAFLERIHSRSYLQMLKEYCREGRSLDPDTYTTPASWELARSAAAGAAAVAAETWRPANGSTSRGLALCRPPGHHATSIRGMGFCLINNVAVAAEYLLSQPLAFAAQASRVAIVDLDLHHGNGTQNIFWRRKDVLYISTHQAPFYPGSGHLEEVGLGDGEGTTVNIPLPAGTGNEGFRCVMEEIILPILDRYRPDGILVSYGFDAHWRDPLGSLLIDARGYAGLIKSLADWADEKCGGRIALFLEGGYDLAAAYTTSLAVTATLLKAEWKDSLGASPYPENSSWQAVVKQAKKIWQV